MSGLGWNFEMNLFPDGKLSIDSNASPMTKKAVEEIKTKFPKGGDCINLDVSIKNAQGLLPSIYMEKAGGNYKIEPIQVRTYQDVLKRNQAYEDRKEYINQMSNFLPDWIGQLEAEFNKKNCRDEFEKKRLQDMATVLTKQSSLQEKSILDPNFKEQYIYIGIGAGILLLGLYVISKK
jgi:hypothetical protein